MMSCDFSGIFISPRFNSNNIGNETYRNRVDESIDQMNLNSNCYKSGFNSYNAL